MKLEEKLDKQAEIITLSVTKNVMEAIDDKIKTISEENKVLKNKVSELENKLQIYEREKRKSNLIFFGVDERGKSEHELVDYIKEIIEDMGVHMNSQEICNIYRIGKPAENKNRPVVITITTQWKKHLIQKNRVNLPQGIYFKEDFPKEVLETRKKLQQSLEEERKKGNLAYIKYDKLVVKKPRDTNREKRKREKTISPTTTASSTKKQVTNILKPNILNYVSRGNTSSISETTNVTKK